MITFTSDIDVIYSFYITPIRVNKYPSQVVIG